MSRAWRAASALVLVLVLAAGCGGGADEQVAEPSEAEATATEEGATEAGGALFQWQDGGLRVGYVGEVPWSYVDDSGEFVGAEADIVATCAERLEITEIEPLTAQFDGLLPGLDADRWDVIAAGMSLRDERLEVAIATQQMYGFGVKIIVAEGNPLGIADWDDVLAAGETVGLVAGGNYQELLEEKGITVQSYESLEAGLADFEAGRINVMSNAELSLVDYVDNNPDSRGEIADPWDYQEIGTSMPALYFNQDNTVLRDAFNDCVTELKEDGTLEEILTEYGFDPGTIPPPGPGEPQS